MRVFGTIFLFIIGLLGPIIWLVNGIEFSQNCGGYLKQAADANSVELAISRLDKAIDYVEKNNLTDGYTSVLWKTEDDNVGFWYQNLKACRNELEDCQNSTQLEQTNTLLKIRESLVDNGESGTELTLPNGISRYPHNCAMGILMWLSAICLLWGILCLGAYSQYGW